MGMCNKPDELLNINLAQFENLKLNDDINKIQNNQTNNIFAGIEVPKVEANEANQGAMPKIEDLKILAGESNLGEKNNTKPINETKKFHISDADKKRELDRVEADNRKYGINESNLNGSSVLDEKKELERIKEAEKEKVKIIGIDLGTTYSCVGLWKNGQVSIFTNELGNRTTPSVVSFTDDDRQVGDSAKNTQLFNPERVIYDSKRMLGKLMTDDTVKDDIASWPFKVEGGDDNEILVCVTIAGVEKKFRAEEISSFVLTKMKSIADSSRASRSNEAVVTVPAYFNEQQRLATKDATKLAGLDVIRLLNEPTAACIAYGIGRQGTTVRDRSVLIFDLGGGTFDVSILVIDRGIFEVKATNGDTHLGGEDFDRAMATYYSKEFLKLHPGCDIQSDYVSKRRLKNALERAKRTLSTRTSTKVELDALFDGIDYSFIVTRAKFEVLCEPLFNKLIGPLKDCIIDGGYYKKKIHDIVLVGGSTRIPYVKNLLQQQFKGRAIQNNINPDEAVAYGAAVQGAVLSGIEGEIVSDILLLDVIPLSLGCESEGQFQAVIVPRNSTIPTTRYEMFGATEDYSRQINIKVFEGERALTKDCHFLGSFDIEHAPVRTSESKIKVNFDLDADGLLTVRAVDLNLKKKGGKPKELLITAKRRQLSNEQIKRMIEDAKLNKKADNDYKELFPVKQMLRKTINEAFKWIMDDKKWALLEPKELADEFHKYLRDLELWLDYNPDKCNDIRVFKEKLGILSNKWTIVRNKIKRNYFLPNKVENENKSNGANASDSIEELT